ncbi:hypothetical protein PF004_g7857 [Phytophthora fragariae]|uniref:Uncharacterized protein n=1 Tax=Phytophthora fragariae TaxID=53985 RepID=A0A6G0P8V3_9STRA|nr:hypothetical protein PF004_g7857 [Phytophthora fragariae]
MVPHSTPLKQYVSFGNLTDPYRLEEEELGYGGAAAGHWGALPCQGGGRKYQMVSNELGVLTFYDDCLRENGKVSFAEMMVCCAQIPGFAVLKDSTPRTRVRRFMNRYDHNQAHADVVRAAVKTSRVAGNTVDLSSETAECCSAQQQSQPESDGEPNVADDVAMDDDVDRTLTFRRQSTPKRLEWHIR